MAKEFKGNELSGIIQEAVDGLLTSGKLEEIVAAKVEDTVQTIVEQNLRSYSDFGKSLDQYVKNTLNVNFDTLDISGYNAFILKVIQKQLDGRMQGEASKRIEEDLKTLLGHPPGEMKLSDLIESFKEMVEEECREDEHDEISFNWDDQGTFAYASWDKEPGKKRHQCAYRIGFHDGRPFTWLIDEADPKKSLFMGRMYAFDRKMFQLYAAGVPIVLDEENVDPNF